MMKYSFKVIRVLLLIQAFPIILFGLLARLDNWGSNERSGGGFFDLIHIMTHKPKTWKDLGIFIVLQIVNVFLWYVIANIYFSFIVN